MKPGKFSSFAAAAKAWIPFCVASFLIIAFCTDWFNYADLTELQWVILYRAVGSIEARAEFIGALLPAIKHFMAFFVLALSTFPLRGGSAPGARRALWYCGAVALISEASQSLTNDRNPRVTDVALDLAASLVGLRLLFVPPELLVRGWTRLRQIQPSEMYPHPAASAAEMALAKDQELPSGKLGD